MYHLGISKDENWNSIEDFYENLLPYALWLPENIGIFDKSNIYITVSVQDQYKRALWIDEVSGIYDQITSNIIIEPEEAISNKIDCILLEDFKLNKAIELEFEKTKIAQIDNDIYLLFMVTIDSDLFNLPEGFRWIE